MLWSPHRGPPCPGNAYNRILDKSSRQAISFQQTLHHAVPAQACVQSSIRQAGAIRQLHSSGQECWDRTARMQRLTSAACCATSPPPAWSGLPVLALACASVTTCCRQSAHHHPLGTRRLRLDTRSGCMCLSTRWRPTAAICRTQCDACFSLHPSSAPPLRAGLLAGPSECPATSPAHCRALAAPASPPLFAGRP